jgi:hypothetical protein
MSDRTKKVVAGAILIGAVLSMTATGCADVPAPTQAVTQVA